MGQLILVAGANGSGKSAYAEKLSCLLARRRVYIATMQPETEDNRRRILRHRCQRAGYGFRTLELPCRVGDAPVPSDCVVLLEDVSNLLANVLFEGGGAPEETYADILALSRRCAALVAVTISGLEPAGYEGETAAYIQALNGLNRRLARRALAVVELKDGAPVWRKGGAELEDLIALGRDLHL